MLLKVTGVINNPKLIEYTPIFRAIYLAEWAMHKLDITSDGVKDLKRFAKDTVKEINNIKNKCVENHRY